MQKKYKIMLVITITLLVGLISLTIAYFALNIYGNPTEDTIAITSKDLGITFSDNDQNFNLNNVQPGALSLKTVTVTNDGSDTAFYTLKFDNLVNSFINDDIVYRASCVSYTNYGTPSQAVSVSDTCASYGNTVLSTQNTPSPQVVGTNLSIPINTTHVYVFTLEFLNKNENQNENQGKSLTSRLVIEESYTATSLAGFLKDSSGNPVVGAIVKIDDTIVTSTTNTYGYFYLNNVLFGNHNLSIEIGGVNVDTKQITLVNANPSLVTYASNLYTINSTTGVITNIQINLDGSNMINTIAIYDN